MSHFQQEKGQARGGKDAGMGERRQPGKRANDHLPGMELVKRDMMPLLLGTGRFTLVAVLVLWLHAPALAALFADA